MTSAASCDLRLCKDMWVLSGDPYILYRAEQAIPFSEKLEGGSVGYPATDEMATELMWFLQRFKVVNHHESDLRRAAARHNLKRVETGRILAGDFRTDAINFRSDMRPRSYQSQAAMLWRANGGLLCADELGVGKTATAIAGIADRSMLPAFVVVPANLTLQWLNQMDRFLDGFHSHVIYQQRNYDLRVVSTCKECGEAATAKSVAIRKCSYCSAKNFVRTLADVYLISYNKVHFWHKEIERVAKSIVFDEAQDLRRCESKRYEACRSLASKIPYRLGLSATPVHHYGGEMFNVMDVLCPKKLGSKKHFREQWCKASTEAGKEPMLKEPEALSRYLMQQGLMVRRTREEVGREIPKSQMIFHWIKPDEKVFSRMTNGARELARVILETTSTNLAKGAQMRASSELEAMVYKATGVSKAPYVAQFVRLLLESGEPVMLFGFHRDCFAKGTKAIKSDGTFINVEDVKVGDVLLGPDGKPRNVKSLTRGHGKMYRIVPNRGEPWVCSENHILAVHDTDKKGVRHSRLTVAQYLRLSERKQRSLVLYRSKAVEFENSKSVVEPWLLGMWLGDGASNLAEIKISKPDMEIKAEMERIASKYGCFIREHLCDNNSTSRFGTPGKRLNTYFWCISSGMKGPKDRNILLRHFKSLGLANNKHIPLEYKTASVSDRWELLAGLIDSDGFVFKNKNSAGNMAFGNSNERLCHDVAYVARSLGLAAFVSEPIIKEGRLPAFVVNISGDLSPLPTRIDRKKPRNPRSGQKNHLHTGFKVEAVGEDDFYGFEVDSDHLFLLDDFTVVHNCYEIWCRELKDFSPVLYTGSEGPAQKEAAKNKFVNGETNLLICSLKSGRGLDGIQHRCRVGVFGELDPSPAVISQSQGRYARDGQKEETLTYMAVSDFGSDPYMLQSLGIKKIQVDGVIQNKEKTSVLSERDSINHLKQLAEQFLKVA